MIEKIEVSSLSPKGLRSANGTFMMIFLIFLAGIFILLLNTLILALLDFNSFVSFIKSITRFFDNPISLYIVVFFSSCALGLCAYLLSYVFLALPLSLIRIIHQRHFNYNNRYDLRALQSFSVYLPHCRNEEDSRFIAFFILTAMGRSVSSDIRFLFSQLMFARSALFSTWLSFYAIFTGYGLLKTFGFVSLRIEVYFLELFSLIGWVLAVSVYYVGQSLFHRVLYLLWVTAHSDA